VDTALVFTVIMVTDPITTTSAVVPATVHPTMAAAPTTTAALVMEDMVVWGTAPTMAGTVQHHLTALDTAALRTEEATTESQSIKE